MRSILVCGACCTFKALTQHKVDPIMSSSHSIEVARLDSALCCTSNRPRFLSALGSKCVYPSLDTSYEEQTQWVILRNIRNCTSLSSPDFSAYRGDSIRDLNILDTKLSRAGVINLCSCFPFLTMLSVGPVIPWPPLRVRVRI